MTVSIDVDINARSAHVKLGALKAQIKELDDNLDFDIGDLDFDLDLGDTLDDLSDAMDEISESFNSDLNETIDRLDGLEFDDINFRGRGDSSGDTGGDSGDHIPSPRQWLKDSVFEDDPDNPRAKTVERFEKEAGIFSDVFDLDRYDDDLTNRYNPRGHGEDKTTTISKEVRKAHRKLDLDLDGMIDKRELDKATDRFNFKTGSMLPDNPREGGIGMSGAFPFFSGNKRNNDLNWKREFKHIYNGIDKATDSFKRSIPSMRTWFNLLAVSIPALAAVAVQALGVATAFGAIAVAGAGMIGLGLLGHGDSMAESFRNAGKQVDELKQKLFETFEPSMDLFAGVQTRFFDAVPGMLEKVSRSLRGMLVFEDEFFDMFNQITKFIAGFFNMVSSNEETISDLWENFRGILGTQIIKFFEWLLEAAHQNQKMLVDLGSVLKTVALALYEVFVMISRTLIMLSPLFAIIARGAKLLNNQFISALLASLAVLYLFTNVLPGIYFGLWSIGVALQRSTIPALAKAAVAMVGYITKVLVAIGANQALAASIATVTTALIGLLALSGIGLAIAGLGTLGMKAMGPDKTRGGVGAGPDGYGGSSGGNTIINEGDTVNVDIGSADNSSVAKFEDMKGGGDRGPTGGSYTSN